jgi:hypothetical protein
LCMKLHGRVSILPPLPDQSVNPYQSSQNGPLETHPWVNPTDL